MGIKQEKRRKRKKKEKDVLAGNIIKGIYRLNLFLIITIYIYIKKKRKVKEFYRCLTLTMST